eukprot:159946-Chlamydomonas_euryale.AAC.1
MDGWMRLPWRAPWGWNRAVPFCLNLCPGGGGCLGKGNFPAIHACSRAGCGQGAAGAGGVLQERAEGVGQGRCHAGDYAHGLKKQKVTMKGLYQLGYGHGRKCGRDCILPVLPPSLQMLTKTPPFRHPARDAPAPCRLPLHTNPSSIPAVPRLPE